MDRGAGEIARPTTAERNRLRSPLHFTIHPARRRILAEIASWIREILKKYARIRCDRAKDGGAHNNQHSIPSEKSLFSKFICGSPLPSQRRLITKSESERTKAAGANRPKRITYGNRKARAAELKKLTDCRRSCSHPKYAIRFISRCKIHIALRSFFRYV